MNIVSNAVAASMAFVGAVAVVIGPEVAPPSVIAVECAELVVQEMENNAMMATFSNCRAGNAPVAIHVPERAPF